MIYRGPQCVIENGRVVFLTARGAPRTSRYHPPVSGLCEWQTAALMLHTDPEFCERAARAYSMMNWIARTPPRKGDGAIIKTISARTLDRRLSAVLVTPAGPGAWTVGPWVVVLHPRAGQSPRVQLLEAADYTPPAILYRPQESNASAVYALEPAAGLCECQPPCDWEQGEDEIVSEEGELSDWMDRECEDLERPADSDCGLWPSKGDGSATPEAIEEPPFPSPHETRPAWLSAALAKVGEDRVAVEGLRALSWVMDRLSSGDSFRGRLPRSMVRSMWYALSKCGEQGEDGVWYVGDWFVELTSELSTVGRFRAAA